MRPVRHRRLPSSAARAVHPKTTPLLAVAFVAIFAAAGAAAMLDVAQSVDTGESAVGPALAQIRPPAEGIDVRHYCLPDKVRTDRLLNDCAMVRGLRSVLPPDRSVEAFLGSIRTLVSQGRSMQPVDEKLSLGASRFDEPIDLGFGIQRTSAVLNGEYVGCEVVTVSHGQEVVRANVACWWSGDVSAVATDVLGDAFIPDHAYEVDDSALPWRWLRKSSSRRPAGPFARTHFEFPDASARMQRALAAALGEAKPATVPPELDEAYHRLTSPFEALIVGRRPCSTFAASEGWPEAQALLKAARFDPLRRILRGPNPEGRAYAALALAEANAIRPADLVTIATLRRTRVVAAVCNPDPRGRASSPSHGIFDRLQWP